MLYYIVLYYIMLYYIILHYVILYCIVLYYIMLYYIILYYILLYYIILYDIILFFISCLKDLFIPSVQNLLHKLRLSNASQHPQLSLVTFVTVKALALQEGLAIQRDWESHDII